MRLLRTFAVNSNEAAAEVEDYTLGMAGPLSVFALGCIVALCMVALFLPLVKLIGGLS
jgi:type II secretory pathway component PulF